MNRLVAAWANGGADPDPVPQTDARREAAARTAALMADRRETVRRAEDRDTADWQEFRAYLIKTGQYDQWDRWRARRRAGLRGAA